MKRFFVILAPVLVIGILAFACEKKAEDTEPAAQTQEATMEVSEVGKVLYYTCPMESHKHVHAHEEGVCPECGMTLVQSVQTEASDAEFYGCPMPEHSHVRHSEPGVCEECGMDLVPAKLKRT